MKEMHGGGVGRSPLEIERERERERERELEKKRQGIKTRRATETEVKGPRPGLSAPLLKMRSSFLLLLKYCCPFGIILIRCNIAVNGSLENHPVWKTNKRHH